MKTHHFLSSALLILTTASFAHANEQHDNSNWYVQASIGYSSVDLKDMIDDDSYDIEDSDTSYELALGYLFTEYVGVKVGYRELGEGGYKMQRRDIVQKLDSIFIAMTGHYPLSEQFELLGSVGFSKISQDLQFTSLDSSHSGSSDYEFTEPYFSIGVEYKFNNTLSILSEFIHQPMPELIEANTYQLGLKYKF